MRKKPFLLIGFVAVAAVCLALFLPSFIHPFHSEEIQIYSNNAILLLFPISTEGAKAHVPPRFSVPVTFSFTFTMLIPGTFGFRGNFYPVFLAIAAVGVSPLRVGPRGDVCGYVEKMFCNDTRVIAILGSYNIPCEYVEVDYSFQTIDKARKSLVTLNDAGGSPILTASTIYSETSISPMSFTNNFYHLVGNNLTIGHFRMQTSIFSNNARANLTFPLNTFFFDLTETSYIFNTFCSIYGDLAQQGEIGWRLWP